MLDFGTWLPKIHYKGLTDEIGPLEYKLSGQDTKCSNEICLEYNKALSKLEENDAF